MVGSINSDAMKNFALAFVDKLVCFRDKKVYRKAYRDVVLAQEQSDSHFEALFGNTDADTKELRQAVLKAVEVGRNLVWALFSMKIISSRKV